MKRLKFIATAFLILFPLYYWYILSHSSFNNDITFQSLVLLYGFVIVLIPLVWLNKIRAKLFSIFPLDIIKSKRFIFYIFCLGMSAVFLNYYVLSAGSNDIILPSNLKFNVIEISGILGGLVLTAASINLTNFSDSIRKRFLNVSFELIVSTVALIFFTVATYYAYKDGAPVLFSFDISSWANFWRGLFFIFSIICFVVGQPLFIIGIVDLITTILSYARFLDKEIQFVGGKNNIVFHRKNCYLAKLITDSDLISFSTVSDAKSKGYSPCPKCIHDK